jgi:hypothetical protein
VRIVFTTRLHSKRTEYLSIATSFVTELLRDVEAEYERIKGLLFEPNRRWAPSDIIRAATLIPVDWGVYAWFSKEDRTVAYIGKAAGKNGLRRRIVDVYLNPDWLETRSERIRDEDQFQKNNPVLVKGKLAIDKGSFRKNVARKHGLKAGVESVEYLTQHFMVSYAALDGYSKEEIVEIEGRLIREFKPEFNTSGK